MVSTSLIESTGTKDSIRSSKKESAPSKPDRKSLKAFIVVEDSEDALNRSACSSLTDDSNLTLENDLTERFILYREEGGSSNPVTGENQKMRRKSKSVSYAQLFFDPETQMLVTLMEINLVDRSSMLQQDQAFFSKHYTFTSFQLQKENDKSKIICIPIQEDSRFQDQTLLTECSSTSSEIDREGPEQTAFENPKLRFSDEPIVFSHHRSSQLWLEENDLSLYLLQDTADPWDDCIRKSFGCTETLKKLLLLRKCISLPSIESKWKVPSAGKGVGSDTNLPRVAYSTLRDD